MVRQKSRPHNSTYTQVAVQWLNQALCSYQSLCLVDSASLRNRHLRVGAVMRQLKNNINNSDIMRRLILFLLTTISVSTVSFGQNELELYKRIYKTADSLKAIEQISAIDTAALFTKAKLLDKKHPSGFFETSGEFLTQSKFNEAAFVYYLGLMRFRYYNSANPDYQASGDGALLGSLKYVFGEPVNMYLRTDIDNFIFIIRQTVSYYSKNDFNFFSKDKNEEMFNAQIKSYDDLLVELETNKEKYKEQWATEKRTMEENIDKMIEEQKNQNEENRKTKEDKKKK
jgi:cell division FtsZ-interacting protein ZapD